MEAFHGDPRIKKDLLVRIDRHLDAGTLVFGPTMWDGTVGSPVGIAIEGTDSKDYETTYGYPAGLASLLDVLTAHEHPDFDRIAFVRAWVAFAEVGADLSTVATRLMLHMLDEREVGGHWPAAGDAVAALHRRDLAGHPLPRSAWADIRNAILASADEHDDAARLRTQLLEAAGWPAWHGRSTLTSAFTAWRNIRGHSTGDGWSRDDEARKDAMLADIWREQESAGKAQQDVDFHRLLVVRDADLASRFVANLTRSNQLVLGAAADLADRCIAFLAMAEPGRQP